MSIGVAFLGLLLVAFGAGAVGVLLDVQRRWFAAVVLFVLGLGVLVGMVAA